MNKAFTKEKIIVLDDNYKIVPCTSSNGVELIHTTIEKRFVQTGRGSKRVTTDVLKDFVKTETFYYTRVAQALSHYSEAVVNQCTDFKEIISKTDEVIAVLKKIDNEFKQFV